MSQSRVGQQAGLCDQGGHWLFSTLVGRGLQLYHGWTWDCAACLGRFAVQAPLSGGATSDSTGSLDGLPACECYMLCSARQWLGMGSAVRQGSRLNSTAGLQACPLSLLRIPGYTVEPEALLSRTPGWTLCPRRAVELHSFLGFLTRLSGLQYWRLYWAAS